MSNIHSSQPAETSGVIRDVDPAHDLPSIVALIELGFKPELGPQGLKVLDKMQQAVRSNFLNKVLPTGAAPTLPGLVWEGEAGRILGNLSLRRARERHQPGWIIGNVVVVPEQRGQGIGRALMEAALEHIQQQGGAWVGLEVRSDNTIARHLYKQLGFKDVSQTVQLLHSAGEGWDNIPTQRGKWRATKPQEYQIWRQLAYLSYGHRQRMVLEVETQKYRFGGWKRKLKLWLQRQRERAWLQAAKNPRRAIRIHTDYHYKFHHCQLYLHPQEEANGALKVINQVGKELRAARSWDVVTTLDSQSPLLPPLERMHFQHQRELTQMYLKL